MQTPSFPLSRNPHEKCRNVQILQQIWKLNKRMFPLLTLHNAGRPSVTASSGVVLPGSRKPPINILIPRFNDKDTNCPFSRHLVSPVTPSLYSEPPLLTPPVSLYSLFYNFVINLATVAAAQCAESWAELRRPLLVLVNRFQIISYVVCWPQ